MGSYWHRAQLLMLYVEQDYLPINYAVKLRDLVLSEYANSWDRYDNPFEKKWVLSKPYVNTIEYFFKFYMTALIVEAHDIVGEGVDQDERGQFKALFRYGVNDYLAMHKDAECDPITKYEKVITACLYLSTDDQVGSPLEFYSGEMPEQRTAVVEPTFNTLVLFDGQWHGCPDPVLHGTRIVATVSFMGQVMEEGRERAYFAPRPGEVWSKEKCELRDLRADPFRYHEVYRV